jgi:hypothetical protein
MDEELKRLQDVLVNGHVICGDCYLHGERPGKHEGPCIDHEIAEIVKARAKEKIASESPNSGDQKQ